MSEPTYMKNKNAVFLYSGQVDGNVIWQNQLGDKITEDKSSHECIINLKGSKRTLLSRNVDAAISKVDFIRKYGTDKNE